MIRADAAAPYFRETEAQSYVQPEGTPFFLRRDGGQLGSIVGEVAATDWAEKQKALIKWTRDPAMFNEADVGRNLSIYDNFFKLVRPPLSGRILDVGGGWGLFRQWWTPGEAACFVVHDPGVERFTAPPPELVKRYYADGLSRPGLFVEGFGEHLPYRDGTYDLVLIASALDHCADPARVLTESHRVLRPGGSLLLIQGFDPEPGEQDLTRPSFARRLWEVVSNQDRFVRAVRMRIFHRGEPHMHHFTRAELDQLLQRAGFSHIEKTIVSERYRVMTIEAFKG